MIKIVVLSAIIFCISCNNNSDTGTADQPETAVAVTPVENQSKLDSNLTLIVNHYLSLKDAMVEADTNLINASAAGLVKNIDSLYEGIDSATADPAQKMISNLASEAKGLIGESGLEEKRREFSMISDNLKDLLKQTSYRGNKLYEQTCPMAFNDTEAASWLSNSSEIVNPYMGKKHSKYSAGMLHCGSVTDSVVNR